MIKLYSCQWVRVDMAVMVKGAAIVRTKPLEKAVMRVSWPL